MNSFHKSRATVLGAVDSSKNPGVSPRRRAPRVLLVDDNPDIVVVMRELLSGRGYDVVAVSSVAAAEAEILREAPDLILSDVIMPGKSGYDFGRESKIKGIEAGADDFLNKPIFAEELFARVNSLIKLKEFTDELETAESVICTLGLSVESRDPYTEGHCERLARNAVAIGRHLGLDEESIVALRRGGYLHDLGKIAVPDEILKKGTNL